MLVELWTDGSGTRIGGPIGYAWMLRAIDTATGLVLAEKSGEGAERDGTNNRAELLAVITGLLQLDRPGVEVHVMTDSAYVADNAGHRLQRWRQNGWRLEHRRQRREGDTRSFMCPLCAAPGDEGDVCLCHYPEVAKTAPRNDAMVANADLWQMIASAMEMHRITWQLVEGHAGIPANEDCDRRAGAARRAQIEEMEQRQEEAA